MRAGTDWTPIYLMIVAAIAIVLIITFVKPLLQQSAAVASDETQAAIDVAGAGLFLVALKGRK
ncbi:MAG: hypothetical protein WC607_03595 [Candidatus Micrarchaeia archaeon]